MAGLFAATLFLSAALLFCVQPMLAKMLLPPLGGSPAVWSTCLVFFQAMLLAGYAYAHLSTRRLGRRAQVVTHVVFLLLCLVFLPWRIPEAWAQALTVDAAPALRLLGALFALAGLPLVAISSTSPLLQRWFSATRHRAASDPYFLYAASNLGSLVALIGYPLFLEPQWRLGPQASLWTAGYVVLAAMVVSCGVLAWRPIAPEAGQASPMASKTGAAEEPLGWSRRGHWLVLGFAPSSLLLGATQYVVTDIASLPLLWVVPLALYLLSFVVAFARRGLQPARGLSRLTALLAVSVVFSLLMRATHPVWLLLGLHLAFLFCAALGCHARLAADRPAPDNLTEFYLWIALGGVLGGAFNALLAPLIFRSLLEYPFAVVLTMFLQSGRGTSALAWRWTDFWWLAGIGLLAAGLSMAAPAIFGGGPSSVQYAVIFGLPLLLAFTQVDRARRFSLGLGAVLLGGSLHVGEHGRALRSERSFFGVSRVTLDPGGQFRRLVHGNTWHGAQFLDPARSCEPLVYYHRAGPAAEVFAGHAARHPSGRVGIIGLGTGSLVCYARPLEPWTFYELDPAVVRLAQDTNAFTYLSRCAAGPVRIVPGDARQRLREAAAGEYTLLVVDAFSSDAIPVHLLTREALAGYLAKLAPGGWLTFHISNRYLDLESVLAGQAREAGLAGVAWEDWDVSASELQDGKAASHWVVLARQQADLGPLNRRAHWLPLKSHARPAWSDDFSSLWGIVRWR